MIKAQVLLTRNADASPAVIISNYDSVMDVTGQLHENIPTNPDLVIRELWTEDLTAYGVQDIFVLSSTIEIDGVISSDYAPPDEMPSAAEFGLLRAYLARNDVSQAQIKEWVGIRPDGRTRAEITDELKAHLLELTK